MQMDSLETGAHLNIAASKLHESSLQASHFSLSSLNICIQLISLTLQLLAFLSSFDNKVCLQPSRQVLLASRILFFFITFSPKTMKAM